ncbi:MAG TPA: 16S rRNA (cytidine(1402)-2'-O)-methyltransferase [Candidatus Nanoarchaeia archaeon]
MSALYIVATPIGNLKDITLRAIEILGEVDLILAEDTRKTSQLLSKYNISKPLESFHEHNEEKKIDHVLTMLRSGDNIAVVSDAGTPTLSDPGFKLVREVIRNEIKVVPIPGASSILASLVASGLPTDQFTFVGYFPKKVGKQQELLTYIDKALSLKPATIILFESPFRVKKTLSLLTQRFPDKNVVFARELTKVHEEFIRGKVSKVNEMDIKSKGEFTILLR